MMRRGIRRLFRLPVGAPEQVQREVRDEVRLHLELRAEQLMAAGVPREEAAARARRMFGEVERVERELYHSTRKRNRAMRTGEWADTVVQDGRYALRMLRRRPGHTVAAVLTLALGIGASATIFSLVDAAMLARFPFAEAERLRILWGVAGAERDRRGASFAEIADWRGMTRSFADITVYDETTLNLAGEGPAVQLQAELVSASYFEVLGIDLAMGRTFRAQDDVPGAPAVAVISDGLWRVRFGGDPGIVGRTVRLDGTAATIIGVTRPGFTGLSFDTEIWSTWGPFLSRAALENRGSRWLLAVGRVREGVSDDVAFADLDAAAARLEELHPEANRERRADLLPLRDFYLDSTRTLLLVLLGAVGLLLLIACANVMNLQLVRGLARGREVAVRHALGAGRGRIVRLLITEAVVLAAVSGVFGIILAHWGLRALLPLVPDGVLPAYADVRIHAGILAFAGALVLGCVVLAGLVPAVRLARGDLSGAFRESQRATVGAAQARLQRGIVAAEMALAAALLVGASVMARSLSAQLRIEPGFRAENVLVGRVSLSDPDAYATPEARLQFLERLLAALRGRANLNGVAVASGAPLRGYNSAAMVQRADGSGDRIRYYRHGVSPSYFAALDIPIVQGRNFDDTDRAGSVPVVIVSESFAARVWPGEDAVGRQLRLSADAHVQVIGVAADVHFRDLTTDLRTPDDDPDVYFPYAQAPAGGIDIIARGSDAAPPPELLRDAVAAADPNVPLYDVQRLQANVELQTASARFGSFVLATFASLALLLAAIGLYGVITFLVQSRRRDIAVRIALGADRSSILKLVMRQGMAVVGGGLVCGALGAVAGTRFLQAFLYDVEPSDPRSIATGTLVLLVTATLANLIPAWRAARTQPERALRTD